MEVNGKPDIDLEDFSLGRGEIYYFCIFQALVSSILIQKMG